MNVTILLRRIDPGAPRGMLDPFFLATNEERMSPKNSTHQASRSLVRGTLTDPAVWMFLEKLPSFSRRKVKRVAAVRIGALTADRHLAAMPRTPTAVACVGVIRCVIDRSGLALDVEPSNPAAFSWLPRRRSRLFLRHGHENRGESLEERISVSLFRAFLSARGDGLGNLLGW